ncbi:MAG: hypothetical protein JNM14_10120 [Ferruginibacter sp.]|nr:hypothetical protein [Ferruginibacter sp.]
MKFRFIATSCFALALWLNSYAQLGGLKNKVKSATTPETPAATKPEAVAEKPAAASVQTPAQGGIMIWPEGSGKLSASEPYLTPLHQKYVGKIVFADAKLPKESATESMLKNSFTLNESIYGRVFAQTAVKNYAIYKNGDPSRAPQQNDKSEYYIKMLIDGAEQKFLFNRDDNSGKYEAWNTWALFVSAKGDDAKQNRAFVIEALNKLAPGKHNIKLQLFGGDNTGDHTISPIAEGEFTLDVIAGQVMKIGRNWASFKAEMSNPALEKQVVEAIAAHGNRQKWKETFSKAKILDKDWYVTRAEFTGLILYRTINVVVYAKWPDGHCTAQEFSVVQQYNNGAFSKTTEYNAIGTQYQIDCD